MKRPHRKNRKDTGPDPALAHLVCPACGAVLNGALSIDAEEISPTEVTPDQLFVTLCVYCLAILQFTKTETGRLTLALLEDDTLLELPADFLQHLSYIQEVIRRNPPPSLQKRSF